MHPIAKYFWNILLAVDQLGNAVGGGDPDETISSRAAKAQRRGKRWGCVLCNWLHKIDPNHCEKSIEHDEGSDQPTGVPGWFSLVIGLAVGYGLVTVVRYSLEYFGLSLSDLASILLKLLII
jgi:hypothetical protein